MCFQIWFIVIYYLLYSLRHHKSSKAFFGFRLTQIKRAREIGRIVVGTSITLGFLLGIPLMMMWGRHSKKSGDSIAKRRREWIRNLQRQKKKEQAAVASAKNGD